MKIKILIFLLLAACQAFAQSPQYVSTLRYELKTVNPVILQNGLSWFRSDLGKLTLRVGGVNKFLAYDDVFTSGAAGLVPASGGGSTNFLRADGTFAAPGGGIGGTLVATRIPFALNATTLTDDSDLSFTGGNRLNASNVTATTQLINSALTAGRVPIISTAGLFADDAGFLFNTTGDILTAGRLVTSTTSTLPGVNVGSFAGDPSSLVDGDLWHNSATGFITVRQGGSTAGIVTSTVSNNTSVPYFTGPNQLGAESVFTYDATNNAVTVPRILLQPTATLAGLNIGSLAGSPSTPANGDFWYNSTTNRTQLRNAGASEFLPTLGGFNAGGVLFQSNTNGSIGSDNDLIFSAGNLLTSTNTTVTTNLINSALTATRVPFIATAGLFDDDADFTFNVANNNLALGNVGVSQIVVDGDNAQIYQATGGVAFNISAGNNTGAAGGALSLLGGASNGSGGGDVRIFGGNDSGAGAAGDIEIDVKPGAGTAGNFKLIDLPTADPSVTNAIYNSSGFAMFSGSSVFKGSATLDFPSMIAGDQQALSITVTGAATGDYVVLGTPGPPTGVLYTGYVSASNTVTVLANNAGLTTRDPASATFRALVIKQ